VVGPPEAELPIRLTLAKWIVDQYGALPPSLPVRRRELEYRRKELLIIMADLEVQLTEAASERAEQLRSRLQSISDELNIVEKQIQVVARYIQRMRDPEGNQALDAAVRLRASSEASAPLDSDETPP
jgi:hypothetical protein